MAGPWSWRRVGGGRQCRWASAGLTDIGKVRQLNEDRYLCRQNQGLWAVADGMGGHDSGEVASRMVVAGLGSVRGMPHLNDYVEALEEQLFKVNARLRRRAMQAGKRMIGTTVVLFSIFRDFGMWLWAGDSRVYCLRDDNLYQLSVDHSQVSDYVSKGMITPEEAKTHPVRNRITRAVGGHDRLFLDMDMIRLEPGDRYLLCSDGLHGYTTDREIREILARRQQPAATCKELVRTCYTHGAGDNVTTVVVDIQKMSIAETRCGMTGE